ncbi:Pimeloyl-ACP methyl ester carboxylesterase [Noviherbaspirillum humi]|uniref:Pimeloyl-ACP methyl ester carboxylesterase n=1 Tax=Noviherbaspirillum humi TaxID=1688639 RepID=A0A239LLV2_9BURK|nr:alpha/beta hydrolase [Noviherbaspirillum humi]SNT31451.1 Pimeloyl-ACP methyl ester carboxylesterase [Noviherbaspirillum humi]
MNARINPSVFVTRELCFARIPSGVCIPYVASGSGEPLVFVHGSLCDYRYWNSQTRSLSAHFLCISISLSHYWPVDDASIQAEFGWKTHVAELAEFISAMDLGPVHLVGHSRGGCVAFQLAREYPHLVKTLTLADPGGPLQIDGEPAAVLPPAVHAVRAKVAELIENGATEAGLELFVDSVSMPGVWRRSPSGFRTMAFDNASTLPKQFRDPLPAYTRAAAAEVGCRTLLIEGERSPRMYRHTVGALAEWMRDADKQTVAGASHGMNAASPAVFNQMIQDFAAA